MSDLIAESVGPFEYHWVPNNLPPYLVERWQCKRCGEWVPDGQGPLGPCHPELNDGLDA